MGLRSFSTSLINRLQLAAAERVERVRRSRFIGPALRTAPAGFDRRGPQWLAALMLPFLVVVMMAMTTVVYKATISIIVSLGLTNVAFLWFIQSIMGLGLLLVGIWGLYKWVESGGFGIFRWS